MNRAITILSFSLAVPSFIFIFTQNKKIALLSAIIAFIACYFLFWLERILKRKGSTIVNFIFFLFQKAKRGCVIEEQKYYYERKDEYNWEFKKTYRIRSKSNTLDRFDDRFCWSGDSTESKISPVVPEHEIVGIHQQEIWTVFSVKFNSIPRGKIATVGSVVSNLVDTKKSVQLFLSATVLPKTKVLRMAIKLPPDFRPNNPRLEIHTSASINSCTELRGLSYDETTNEIELPPVKYPRANWRYVILWD